MNDDGDPIAYTALQPGAAVKASDGQQVGMVETVLIEEEVDVFDGIVVRTADGLRFVDADHVGQIFTTHVLINLSAAEAADLPVPDRARHPHAQVNAAPSGRSLSDRLGRMFGRGKQK